MAAAPVGLLEKTPAPVKLPRTDGSGRELPPPGGYDRRDDGSGGLAGDPARFGLWAFLGTISMMFIGFSSAYIVRRTAADWRPMAPPPILWWNTGALLLSSALLQVARGRWRRWDLAGTAAWLGGALLLGVAFVAGQVLAWRSLVAQGITLSSNPHSSFFYVLAGLHAVHVLGGMAWFAVVLVRLRRSVHGPHEGGLGLFALYWHFLGILWVYLLLLVFVF